MKCPHCGAEIPFNSKFCPSCGQPAAAQPPYSNPAPTPYGFNSYNSAPMDEKAFYDTYASKGIKSWVTWLIVICFVTAAISAVPLFLGNLLSIIDIAFYVVIGILLRKNRNWKLAMAVAIYCGVFSVIGIIVSGTMSGIVALIVSIFATIKLKKVADAYVQYKRSGLPPMNTIN